MAAKLKLRNDLADCDKIWCVLRDHAAVHIAQVMGVVHFHVHTRRCAPFPYLRNSWTDCTEICYVVREPLARRFTEVDDGVQLHLCTHFLYLGNGRTDCTEIWCVVMGPTAICFIGITSVAHCTPTRAQQLFHISITAGCFVVNFGMLLDTINYTFYAGLGIFVS